jgi:hypothetical protein
MTMHPVVSSESTITEEAIAEIRLWTAVVAGAVQDWRFGTMRARRDAEEFLFGNSPDFDIVCGRAGLDSNCLRERLLKIGQKVGPEVRFIYSLAA